MFFRISCFRDSRLIFAIRFVPSALRVARTPTHDLTNHIAPNPRLPDGLPWRRRGRTCLPYIQTRLSFRVSRSAFRVRCEPQPAHPALVESVLRPRTVRQIVRAVDHEVITTPEIGVHPVQPSMPLSPNGKFQLGD